MAARAGARVPLPIPAPVRIGQPGSGFPWPWSIVRWFPGTTATTTSPRDFAALAVRLGEFIRALHQPAPDDAPHNPWRSIPLDTRTERLHEHLDHLKSAVDREHPGRLGSSRGDATLARSAAVDTR